MSETVDARRIDVARNEESKLEAIKRLCANGETIEWIGQPDELRSMRRRQGAAWMGLFALLIAVVCFSMNFLILPNRDIIFSLMSVLVLIIGLLLIAAPTLAGRSARKKIYALTSSRALIVTLNEAGPFLQDSCELKTAANIVARQTDKSGYGDLALNYKEVSAEDGYGGEGFFFFDIPDVLNVKTLAEMLVKNAAA